MSIIPGSIPVTGFIAPTDTSDDYAVTDSIYGIDGLRNVADYTARNNISLERRRAGMVVGTINDGKYWRLKNQAWTLGSSSDWELFLQVGASGSIIGNGLKYVIEANDDLTIPTYNQYWIYGDLTVIGQLTNYGEVVIADGGLVMSGGTFSNYGTLTFVTLMGTTASATASYISSSTIGFTITGSTVSAQVITGSLTASYLNSTGNATSSYVLSVNNSGVFEWVPQSGSSVVGGNGLSVITPGVIGLGGTLSQDSAIDGTYSLYVGITTPLSNIGFQTIGDNSQLFLNNAGSGPDSYSLMLDSISKSSTLVADIGGTTSAISLEINRAVIAHQAQQITLTSFTQSLLGLDTSVNNYIVVEDNFGLKGLVYADDYTSNFTQNSLVTKQYVDTQISGITGSGSISTGSGLTQSGTTASRVFHLGGTLTQNAIFDGYYDVTFGNTTPLSWFFTKVGVGGTSSQIELIPGEIDIANINGTSASRIHFYSNGSTLGVGDNSLNNSMVITDDIYLKGMVYANDYTSNFTTFSLVTKGYVDGIGVTGGNGLGVISPGIIGIGGTLSQNTTIDGGATYTLNISNLNGSSNNTITAGNTTLRLIEGNTELSDYSTTGFVNLLTNYGSIYLNGANDGQSNIDITPTGAITTALRMWAGPTGNGVSDGSTNNRFILRDIGNKGLVYHGDYTSNFTNNSLITKQYVDSKISSVTISIPTIYDKNLVAMDSFGDGDFSGATISNTPLDNSYVAVFINGLEYLVGNGVTNSVDCYFSNTGGSSARGFSSLHPNGKIQANDGLYWNGSVTGLNLTAGWRIAIHYLI